MTSVLERPARYRAETDPLFTATPAPKTTTVSITNQLTVPVDIYDQFNPSTDQQTLPIQYTKLGTIAPNATGSVTTIREVALLVATITGPIAEVNGNYYHLFPIKAMSGTQLTFGSPPPLAYTITADDRGAAVLSFQFHKFAMANPSSALAKNFNKALKAGFTAVDTFFQGTLNFKKCTMASWNLVMTWLNNNVSGWQGNYFLYEAPPSPAPANFVTTLLATLEITSDATTNAAVMTLCTADAQGNPVYATPVQQTTLIMAGDGTMQDSDPGTDTPVTLTPVWMNVVQTPLVDGQPTPKYLIGNAVNGTVGGTNVVSSQTARQLPGQPPSHSPSEESGWDKLFSKGIEIIGALAGLVAIYEFAQKKFGKGEGEKETAKSKAKDQADLDKQTQTIDDQIQAEVTDPVAGVPAAEAATAADVEVVNQGYADVVTQTRINTMTEVLDERVAAVEQQVQTDIENGVTPTQEFEDAFQQVQTDAETALNNFNNGDFDLSSLDTSVQELSTQAQSASTEVQQAVEELQTSYDNAQTETQALDQAQQERQTQSEDPETDSGYDPVDDNTPPETSEIPPVGE